MRSYKVIEKWLSLGSTYVVRMLNDQEIGVVKGRWLDISPEFFYKNPNGEVIFRLKGNFWRTRFFLYDSQNMELARFSLPFFFFFSKSFDVYIQNRKLRVIGGFWAMNFQVLDENNQELFRVDKKFWALRDTFKLDVREDFDMRIALAAAVVVDERFHERND
ncbi:MAG: hypothetical protein ACFFBD_14530 [Candidatus Hodarchaeota archaeon]